METVICTLIVVVNMSGINFQAKGQAEGQVLKSNGFNLLVDFSKDAKLKNWQGDYSQVLVEKKDCI